MSVTAPSEQSALRIELTVTLMAGILNGSVSTLQPLNQSQKASRLQEAQRTADFHRNECFAIAGSLMKYDEENYGSEPNPTRVRSVATLFAASVSGLITNGTQPGNALPQVNRTRERLFLTANRIVNQQRDHDLATGHPADAAPRRLGVGNWRQGRPLEMESQAEPAPLRSSGRQPGM